ncbi:MAG TPA: type II CAAX endopeptidase family protein [Acidimicrobiia bacterium]|nr:type II CAAX endopeptidase family protein [Acidimicrobiia bacterium]
MSGGPISRSWSVLDFVLVWLGGQLGTAVFFALAVAVGDDDWLIVLPLTGLYIGHLGVFWYLSRQKDASTIGLAIERGDFFYIALGLVLQVAIAVVFLPLNELLFPEGRPPQDIAEIIASADTLFLQVSLVLAAVVFGPVTEELMYRGVLLRALEKRGKWWAILASSAVFAILHMAGLDTDQFWLSAAVLLPPLFILSVVLAWLTLKTGRLGPAIFLHSGWNLLSAFVLLLPTELLEQVG